MLFLHCKTTITIRSGMKKYLFLTKLSFTFADFSCMQELTFWLNFVSNITITKLELLAGKCLPVYREYLTVSDQLCFLVIFLFDGSYSRAKENCIVWRNFAGIQSKTMKFRKCRLVRFNPISLFRFIFCSYVNSNVCRMWHCQNSEDIHVWKGADAWIPKPRVGVTFVFSWTDTCKYTYKS